MVAALLDAGVSVNAVGYGSVHAHHKDITPLMNAAYEGYKHIVEMLLNAGGRVGITRECNL